MFKDIYISKIQKNLYDHKDFNEDKRLDYKKYNCCYNEDKRLNYNIIRLLKKISIANEDALFNYHNFYLKSRLLKNC